jgi:hypothetical protein
MKQLIKPVFAMLLGALSVVACSEDNNKNAEPTAADQSQMQDQTQAQDQAQQDGQPTTDNMNNSGSTGQQAPAGSSTSTY